MYVAGPIILSGKYLIIWKYLIFANPGKRGWAISKLIEYPYNVRYVFEDVDYLLSRWIFLSFMNRSIHNFWKVFYYTILEC